MSQWLVSVPVWGEPYLTIFLQVGLPSIERAAAIHGGTVILVAHSDNEGRERIRKAVSMEIYTPEMPKVEGGNEFTKLSACHAEVLTFAKPGTRVCLLTGDMVVSDQAFLYADRVMSSARMAIACAGIRATWDGTGPDQVTSRGLLEWAWAHRHPITTASIYPDGQSQDVSRMYFQREGTVVSRQVLPHPFAIVRDERPLAFNPTVDANLLQSFYENEIYVVTDPDELAIVELSVPDKAFHLVNSIQARLEHDQVIVVNPTQRHTFQHQVVIKGKAMDCGDEALVSRVIEESMRRYPLYR